MLNKTLILLNSFPGDWFIEFRTRQHYNHLVSKTLNHRIRRSRDYNMVHSAVFRYPGQSTL